MPNEAGKMRQNAIATFLATLSLTLVIEVSATFWRQSGTLHQQPYVPQTAVVHNLESRVFGNVYPYSQYTRGYDGGQSGGVYERIDEPVQFLPTVVENREASQQNVIYQFPDTHVNNEVDNTKQIHSYTVQKRVVNQLNRVFRRYLKALNVNTVFNTNVQRVNHPKVVQVLNVVTQETHQPKLRVQYSRTDTVKDLGETSAPVVVETKEQFQRLPPVILPAQVEKVGYDGQPLAPAAAVTTDPAPLTPPA